MHKAGHDVSLQNVTTNQKHISTILDTNLSPIILLKNVDMAINRGSGGVFHLNKDRKISKLEKEKLLSAVGTPIPQHKQLVLGAQMNTSKEHFSPTNGEILPQNADNFAQNLDQSAPNLPNANLNSLNLSGDLPNANLNAPNLPNANANFHNPRAEFSANNAYENFSNPNNPRAFMRANVINSGANGANLGPNSQNVGSNLGANLSSANSSANLSSANLSSEKKHPQNEQI